MKRSTICLVAVCGWVAAAAGDDPPKIAATPLLKSALTWEGKSIRYPEGEAEISGVMVEIPVGSETGWHRHPVPTFGMVLQGVLEVRLRDGKLKRLAAGEAMVEVQDTLHNGRNAGDVPVKMIVFYAGAKGVPLTVTQEEP